MTAQVPSHVCPFCGVAADVPHETQARCIAALHAEIARTRELLEYVRPTAALGRADGPDDPDAES
jgi:hypothetical protein